MLASTTRTEATDREVFEKLKCLEEIMKNSDLLSSDEVSDVIEGIRESMDAKFQGAENELRTMEVDLRLATAQRDHWESEANQLAMELNEMKEREQTTQIEPSAQVGAADVAATTKRSLTDPRTLEADLADMKHMHRKMKQCMLNLHSERKELRLTVARLNAEMEEIKHENEELVEMVNQKEAETMDMITQLNNDMNSSINQNQHASFRGTSNYQHPITTTTTTLFAARMGDLSGKLRVFMHAREEADEKPDDMTEATILDTTTRHSDY